MDYLLFTGGCLIFLLVLLEITITLRGENDEL
jgi:hypothetical protein